MDEELSCKPWIGECKNSVGFPSLLHFDSLLPAEKQRARNLPEPSHRRPGTHRRKTGMPPFSTGNKAPELN
jgi:hypothetical protein